MEEKTSVTEVKSNSLLAEIEDAIPHMGKIWYAYPLKYHALIDELFIKTGRMESRKRPDGGRLFRLANASNQFRETTED